MIAGQSSIDRPRWTESLVSVRSSFLCAPQELLEAVTAAAAKPPAPADAASGGAQASSRKEKTKAGMVLELDQTQCKVHTGMLWGNGDSWLERMRVRASEKDRISRND